MPKYKNKCRVKCGLYLRNYWQLRKQMDSQNCELQPLAVDTEVSTAQTMPLEQDEESLPDLVIEEQNEADIDNHNITGIFFTDGYFWHIQRRFSLRYMRDFGFGRRDETLEAVMATEIQEMLDMSVNGPKYPAENDIVKGDLIHLPDYFAAPFINGLLYVFSRMTLPRADYHSLWELARGSVIFLRNSDDMGRALVITPWLKDIIPNWSGYAGLKKGNQYLIDFYTKLINEVMATHDEAHDRHFLDIYIRKMKEEVREKGRTTFSVEQLVLICTDYTFAAASAVESVLVMLTERLLLQPEIQEKIHDEIDRVVGKSSSKS